MEQREEVLLTTREAGLITGVSSTTVRRWIKEGRIPGFIANTKGLRLRYMISEEAIKSFRDKEG